MMKKYLCILAVLLFFVLNSGTSHACTGVYIGKEASADGTFILARSNDCPKIFATRMMTVPRVEWDSGREMPVDNNSAVFAQLPETTYKYTATPFMDSTISISGTGMDDAVCVNEYGVTMTMSVTAFSNEAALAADPWVCAGLQEKAFEDAKELLNQVRWTMSFNSNTMKLGKNPETGEYLTTERVLSPVTVTLDGSAYGRQQSIIAN